MYSGFSRKVLVQGLLLTVCVSLLCAVVFCGLFYLLPFKNSILTAFANISLGLSVFCGAFFVATHTPFSQLKKVFFLPFAVLLLLFAATFAFGTFDAAVFLQKTGLVLVAAILGEIAGRS
jgi:putative membrane protein (TIGR04086 family)